MIKINIDIFNDTFYLYNTAHFYSIHHFLPLLGLNLGGRNVAIVGQEMPETRSALSSWLCLSSAVRLWRSHGVSWSLRFPTEKMEECIQLSGLPRWLSGKESACNAEDSGSVPGSWRSPGEGNGNPLQYSCLGKSHGQRSLAGYSPWDHVELDMTSQQNKNNLAI